MKLSLILSSLFLLTSCGNPGGAQTPTGPTASPSATSTLPASEFAYSLPLSLELKPECQLADASKPYQVSSDGKFSFPQTKDTPDLMDESPVKTQVVQLNATELAELDAVLEKNNLAAAFKDSKPVADDAPQTMECRTVSVLNMQVNDAEKSYDRNGRKFTHSDAYRTQWKAIEDHLEKLAESKRGNATVPVEAKYAIAPLKLEAQLECGNGTAPMYEIKPAGQFISYSSEGTVKTQRDLTPAESQRLSAQLAKSDLQAKKKASVAVPADAPQTKECRAVDVLSVPVNGITTAFDRNGRDFQHTDAYSKAFDEIVDTLADFDKSAK